MKYVTFNLGDEVFAIEVGHVREILELPEMTKIPHVPDYIRGVVNVRGSAIPVMDLRAKFGLSITGDTMESRILVLELKLEEDQVLIGGLADSVRDVIELDDSNIDPPPAIAMRWRAELISGMGKIEDQFIIILNTKTILSSDALQNLSGVEYESAEESESTCEAPLTH